MIQNFVSLKFLQVLLQHLLLDLEAIAVELVIPLFPHEHLLLEQLQILTV